MQTYQFKVVLLGSTNVGKSSIVSSECRDLFSETMSSTIGAAFVMKRYEVSPEVTVSLEIWDTAGQERYNSITPMYYRGSKCVIIVFDLTSTESYLKAQQWVSKVNDLGAKLFLVGNKEDLTEIRAVTKEAASCYASVLKMDYFETSAKTKKGVKELFGKIVETLPRTPENLVGPDQNEVIKSSSSGCC
ncbi:rab5, putative [Entamoeba invadens IP1]|uniref:rab5, putative n=1 Tax=Entamoeba invadens IP1 TaxID=370355 RepID=UPI0002C3F784|nr:rab5, putative [Entamoeba invadens IP1]ELP85149.1 rab5, putative [Entamoeba invadens IP1]|eukprot:XP_004184495.1 rab5, putative [Entamoeba invadens IP1]